MADFQRQYVLVYFDTRELVTPSLYKKRGPRSLMLMDAHIVYSIDTLRAFLTDLTPTNPKMGALTVNNWMYGGTRKYSGLRLPGDDYYSDTSQHPKGRAIDAISKHYSAEQLRNFIIDNRDLFPYVTCIEADVDWLHIDCRNLPSEAPTGSIMLVYPDGTLKYV